MRRAGFFKPFEGVVIGQGKDAHAVFMSTGNQRRGRECPVGSGAVAMQVNIHSGAFVFIDVCYYAVTSCFWLPL